MKSLREKIEKSILRKKILEKLVSVSLIPYCLENYSKKMISQLKKKKLLSKILKEKYFWKSKFITTKNTLDPRPDTELLIESFLEKYKNYNENKQKYNLIDCCCGTGAIGISINLEIESLRTTYLDIDHKALQICKKNIRNQKLWHKSKIYKCSLENINNKKKYDFLVSNPPYLKEEEIRINKDILAQDPYISLYGGKDGLYFYRLLGKYIYENIKIFGIIEIDSRRKEEIENIFNKYNFKKLEFKKDYNNLWRVLIVEI